MILSELWLHYEAVKRIQGFSHTQVTACLCIEETVGAMADLVKAGKVRYLGLSEASKRMLTK